MVDGQAKSAYPPRAKNSHPRPSPRISILSRVTCSTSCGVMAGFEPATHELKTRCSDPFELHVGQSATMEPALKERANQNYKECVTTLLTEARLAEGDDQPIAELGKGKRKPPRRLASGAADDTKYWGTFSVPETPESTALSRRRRRPVQIHLGYFPETDLSNHVRCGVLSCRIVWVMDSFDTSSGSRLANYSGLRNCVNRKIGGLLYPPIRMIESMLSSLYLFIE